MPAEVLQRRPHGAAISKCEYCRFVWFNGWDEHSGRSKIIPAGFYDNALMGKGFVARTNYRLRGE
jgi:hypothetical protein